MTCDVKDQLGRPPPSPRRLIPRLVVNFLFAPLAYAVARPHVGSDVAALAIAGAIPAVWTAAFFVVRRRFEPIGAFAVAGFCVALLISLLTGGSALALKLHGDFLLTGVIGFAFVVSAIVRRPLLPVILRLLGRDVALNGRSLSVTTALVGVTLLTAAVVHVILALTLPTSTYLVMSHVVNWMVYGTGLAVLLLLRRRAQARGRS